MNIFYKVFLLAFDIKVYLTNEKEEHKMLNNKNVELFLSGLSQLQPLVKKVERLEDIYNTSREKVLSEDLFWSDDKDEIYNIMREHDVASLDYIKGLKKELQELMILASTISVGYSFDLNKEDK